MGNAHKRKKQPELLRRTLLDCAARLAVEKGLSGVTIQAVSDAAGVTKGGLMHHFPTKQTLVEAVFGDFLEQLDAEITALIARDDEPKGSFTRAYIETVFTDHEANSIYKEAWAALYATSITDPALRCLWSEWLRTRLERYSDTDHEPHLEIARLAADGVWVAYLLRADGDEATDLSALRTRLLAMTRKDFSLG
ncbi:TetR family transcriptional regulator [Rhizobium sp. KVB221]|uniref:TetR family transcriptional regulator n=1 Tax=Rhizobium setariae TaxID=2801340 RepID=A0A937CQH0_9HYPH|nr:TetR/AcrR family transcriptional regulator [Rhizobium setariae]MBL0372997.1 TetR family transcriptional regulator [Rhizobium setariae]